MQYTRDGTYIYITITTLSIVILHAIVYLSWYSSQNHSLRTYLVQTFVSVPETLDVELSARQIGLYWQACYKLGHSIYAFCVSDR